MRPGVSLRVNPEVLIQGLASKASYGKNVSAIMNASEGHELTKAVKNRELRALPNGPSQLAGRDGEAECKR